MNLIPSLLLVAGLSQYPTVVSPSQVECYDYDLFNDVLQECPSSDDLAQLGA